MDDGEDQDLYSDVQYSRVQHDAKGKPVVSGSTLAAPPKPVSALDKARLTGQAIVRLLVL